MGVDATVFIELRDGHALPKAVWPLEESPFTARADDDFSEGWFPDGATHEVDMDGQRLFNDSYRRGYWPWIGAVLLELICDTRIARVWYGGDSGGLEEQELREVSLETIAHLNAIWQDTCLERSFAQTPYGRVATRPSDGPYCHRDNMRTPLPGPVEPGWDGNGSPEVEFP